MEGNREWSSETPNTPFFNFIQKYQQGVSASVSPVRLPSEKNSIYRLSNDGLFSSDDFSPSYSVPFDASKYLPSYHFNDNITDKFIEDQLGLSQSFYTMNISDNVKDPMAGKYFMYDDFHNGSFEKDLGSNLLYSYSSVGDNDFHNGSFEKDLGSSLLYRYSSVGDSLGGFLADDKFSDSNRYCNRGCQLQSPLSTHAYKNGFYGSYEQDEMNSLGVMGINNSFNHSNGSSSRRNFHKKPNREDSLILEGKSLSRGSKKQDRSRGVVTGLSTVESPHLEVLLSAKSLAEVQGNIYSMAQDQNGCRFLQKIFEEGTSQEVRLIFDELIVHIVELTMKPFGNYLVQKLLDVCTDGQRMQILLMVSSEPGLLIKISLNTYGTRVIQKLIETLKTRQQVALVISALRQGCIDLIMDLNGNHVIQRCLQTLSNEENKFIFDTAAKFCVGIATHRHGCCVLQRCMEYAVGTHQDKLITEISKNGLFLAQDPYGNYVIQYIIEGQYRTGIAILSTQFRGHYVRLSVQKCGSHVVEKCLQHFGEGRSQIVHELLSVSRFEQLLQDPFANYVIQSALAVTKGPLHALLVEAVKPHSDLRTNPHCKRIFSRNVLKK